MFKIRFRGTQNEEIIKAENLKSAKWIFALKHGLNSIAYVQGSKAK